ncbi:MAG: FKBP-type peptidyl-prolyl cis-trans isomerase [Bacteroidales bacterium]|nr:FKBP-type peptidyl-prolyl cis-trans isomerase [Bacteroidales bacterium]
MMKKAIFFLIFSLIIIAACDDDDDSLSYDEQLAVDIEKIENYLLENNLSADSTGSGLHYIIDEEGTGDYPDLESFVKVNYTGTLLNGEVFDEGTIDYYPLYSLIEGWQEGLQLFREGGYGTLFIPSGLGYGSTAQSTIPANSVLIFEVELVGFVN